ncbi:kinase-like protein [Coprinopsis marcescibilis]|uniref:non-specific serine/threonine protein kinase n=1 Tax=Coprinopsis marcescibilis TaxID=230819 RepID=A0A5C3KF79_COPMA|nr:kinase-like protein [Coprinopsis marcescibilis]
MSQSTSQVASGTLIAKGTIQPQEVIGTGGFGTVFRAIAVEQNGDARGQTYAVKVQPRTSISKERTNAQIREGALHSFVSGSHPATLPLLQIQNSPEHLFFVMPHLAGGDLFAQISNKRYLGQNKLIRSVFGQAIDAVAHLHNHGVFHRDLKPENILCVDEQGSKVAVCDFGLATTVVLSEEFGTGSMHHMSLECAASTRPQQPYSPRANDVWSLGIILVNLATGRALWGKASLKDVRFRTYLQSPTTFIQTHLPISSSLIKLLKHVLDPNPNARASMKEFSDAFEEIEKFYSEDMVISGKSTRRSHEAVQETAEKLVVILAIGPRHPSR